MKKNDVIIIFVLVCIAGLIYGGQQFLYKSNDNQLKYVCIYLEGNLYKKTDLGTPKKIKMNTEYGYNLIEISDGKVVISESDCHSKVCVRSNAITRIGESIVCLPHKLYVTIEGERQEIDAITN